MWCVAGKVRWGSSDTKKIVPNVRYNSIQGLRIHNIGEVGCASEVVAGTASGFGGGLYSFQRGSNAGDHVVASVVDLALTVFLHQR